MPRAASKVWSAPPWSSEGGIDVVALDQYMPGLDGLRDARAHHGDPACPTGGVRHRLAGFQIAVTALKAGAADYLVKDVQGDFIPLLHVAAEGALRQAAVQQGAR